MIHMSYLTSNTVYRYIFFKKPARYMVGMMMGGKGGWGYEILAPTLGWHSRLSVTLSGLVLHTKPAEPSVDLCSASPTYTPPTAQIVNNRINDNPPHKQTKQKIVVYHRSCISQTLLRTSIL